MYGFPIGHRSENRTIVYKKESNPIKIECVNAAICNNPYSPEPGNDIIHKDFTDGDYNILKKTLIDRYSPSDEERVQRVLYEFRYDGGKPSALFRQMIIAEASQVPYKPIVKRFSTIIPTVPSAIASFISEVIEKFDANETRDFGCETRMVHHDMSVADNKVRHS